MVNLCLTALIDALPERTALNQLFCTDAGHYQRNIELVYLKSWLYAGHISAISSTGDDCIA
jgi:hypothetical protein